MSDEEMEEVILALKASGFSMPEFKILPDGSYLLYANGQKIGDITVHSGPPRSQVH